MAGPILIPEELQAKVRTFGEVTMGANRVALVLRDGTVIEDVILAWGREVVRVGGGEPVDLPIDQVSDVIDRSDDSGR
jgi:hypothetical protein